MSSTVALQANWRVHAPWTDKKGRLHPLRAAVFCLLLLPGLWLGLRWAADMLGSRALNELIHGTGYWAAWILIASLMVTPAKAVLGLPNLVVVRRMVGNAALVYASIHLLLYVTDQKWRLLHVAAEIALRFYLTVGFVALLGLAVLGATSTDGWVRRLGRGWKRLHRIVYGIVVLGVLHYFLQTKADKAMPLLALGIVIWLMLWRALPAGRDRGPLAMLGLAAVSALLTLATEWAWYRFGTRIDPMRVLRAELEFSFGLRPAAQVLTLGLLFAAAVQVRSWGQSRAGQYAWFTIALFAAGALVGDVASLVFGLEDDDGPEGATWALMNLVWLGSLGLLGWLRWTLCDSEGRKLIDALGLGCAAYLLVLASSGNAIVEAVIAAVLAALWGVAARQTWLVSRGGAAMLVPLGVLLGLGVAGLL